jgi:Lysylphosphatidylglycerol synthase TM region
VLYATFRAFGEAPPVAVLVQAYFVGMLANLLPLPGGIGGVDGGMIGALVAFGVGGGLALIAVLVYRLLAFWLPSIPGVIAYFQLRRTVTRWELRDQACERSGPRRSPPRGQRTPAVGGVACRRACPSGHGLAPWRRGRVGARLRGHRWRGRAGRKLWIASCRPTFEAAERARAPRSYTNRVGRTHPFAVPAGRPSATPVTIVPSLSMTLS